LKDYDRLRRLVDAAERAGALSATARGTIAEDYVARGQFAEAEQQLLAALMPNQPPEQVRQPGVGGWLTRLELARMYGRMGNPQAALHAVERVLLDPEAGDRTELAQTAVRLAVQVGDMVSLWRCLDTVSLPDEDDFDGHLRRMELRSDAVPGRGDLRSRSPVEHAILVSGPTSIAAYNAVLGLNGTTVVEAAHMLFVAARLHGGGELQAALDVLERLLDAQPGLPQLHLLLIRVLTGLERYDDALASNTILQSLSA
jgi:tetratricopeptide (TPR) repeat protein